MKKNLLALILIAVTLFLGQCALAAYTPLEPIPGTSGTTNTFPAYINAIYKFAIWSVGISAMFMIIIGGFMYFTAAGNNSKMESGKKIIADALYGLIAVLVAWTVLNTINPNLTNISLESVSNLRSTTSQ